MTPEALAEKIIEKLKKGLTIDEILSICQKNGIDQKTWNDAVSILENEEKKENKKIAWKNILSPKLLFFLLVAGFVIWFFAIRQPAEVFDENGVYKNKDLEIEIQLPLSWEKDEEGSSRMQAWSNGSVVLFREKFLNVFAIFLAYEKEGYIEETGISIEEIFSAETLRQSGIKIDEKGEFLNHGNKILWYFSEKSDQFLDFSVVNYVIDANDKFYLFGFHYRGKKDPDEFHEIMKNAKF